MIALRGSVPNLCTSTNLTHVGTLPSFCSAVYDMRSLNFYFCIIFKFKITDFITWLNSFCSKIHNCQGNKQYKGNQNNQYLKLGKKRQLRNRIEHEQKAKSQSDLSLRRREFSPCCSLQYLQDIQKWNECRAKTEVY